MNDTDRQICKTCRYWSEMTAKAQNGQLVAICLTDAGPLSQQYTGGTQTCANWQGGKAVDAW